MISSDPYQQSGRTTRMLLEAWDHARDGKSVSVVYGASGEHWHMKRILIKHAPEFDKHVKMMCGTRIELQNGGSITFWSMNDGLVNVRHERIRGVSPKTPVFVDHHVYDLL